eukprot:CAMPEP_0115174936 /NCGR_PEP_ID=MMETSP0270-20121206/4098_1 /TAXON_ID=71861 /ORGANISM="Scrippsiella trochoidea, Strain CCMP3099" /LENGTH=779 /DNA_ID=CAMNT_0002587795 /DNA_START=65 /DNA_END=2404 /DNA_ORIENTATION=-
MAHLLLFLMDCSLLFGVVGLTAGAPSFSEAAASHAASAALAALDDMEALQGEVSQAERKQVDMEEKNPLEAYVDLNNNVGRLFQACLIALRHLAAAHAAAPEQVGATSQDLQEMAALEEQVGGILTAHAKEPIFFWHGPKWMVLSKVRKIFTSKDDAGRSMRDRLQQVANVGRSAGELREWGPKAIRQLHGKASVSLGDFDAVAAHQKVPAVGVAVGDVECGDQSSNCKLGEILDAARTLSGKAAHVLVLPCGEQALKAIGGELQKAGSSDDTFVSFVLSPTMLDQGGQELLNDLSAILAALGRRRFDLLWLPYDAFKKRAFPRTKAIIEALTSQGTITAYGIHTEARSKTLATKLLDREPAPVAWLTPHDLTRPAEPEAVAAARALGVVAVGLARTAGVPGTAAGLYLQAVVGPDLRAQEAAQHKWTLQQGLAVVLRPGALGTPSAGASVLKATKEMAPLSADAAHFLRVIGTASKEEAASNTEEPATSADGLGAALQLGRKALAEARLGSAEQVVKDRGAGIERGSSSEVTKPGNSPLVPAVRPETLEGLDEQAKQYKANNHVIYKENFFDEATWSAIVRETKRLWKSKDIDANCNLDGKNRLGGYVLDHTARNSSLYRLIYGNEQFRRWVSAVNGEGEAWPSDFPIELREYGTESKGMACHPDLQMYAVAKKDMEFAVTVDNDSTCQVTYWDAKRVKHKVNTKGNSVMMVRANAAEHCVSPTEGGSRTILKFIYVGDYRKSDTFWHYTGNECGPDNPNRVVLESRRDPEAAEKMEL